LGIVGCSGIKGIVVPGVISVVVGILPVMLTTNFIMVVVVVVVVVGIIIPGMGFSVVTNLKPKSVVVVVVVVVGIIIPGMGFSVVTNLKPKSVVVVVTVLQTHEPGIHMLPEGLYVHFLPAGQYLPLHCAWLPAGSPLQGRPAGIPRVVVVVVAISDLHVQLSGSHGMLDGFVTQTFPAEHVLLEHGKLGNSGNMVQGNGIVVVVAVVVVVDSSSAPPPSPTVVVVAPETVVVGPETVVVVADIVVVVASATVVVVDSVDMVVVGMLAASSWSTQ
jgi:hypothetical protein